MTQIHDPADLIKAQNVKEKLVCLLNTPVTLTITDNLRSIITVKSQSSGFIIRLHHMFLEAGETVLAALARWAAGSRKRTNQTLRAFIDQHQAKITKPVKPAKPRQVKLITRGRCFDLNEAVQRIQQEYFNPDLNIRITWSHNRKKPGRRNIRLGSYSAQTKLIRINPVLDQVFVPPFVLDDIVFHEILHLYLGYDRKNGRTRVHHGIFKKLEKEYRHHRAAQAWIKENLSRLVRKERVQGAGGEERKKG